MWHKVINSDNFIIDVLETLNYVRFQERNKLLLSCGKNQAQGILSSSQSIVWHLSELLDFPPTSPTYETVTIKEITEDEYLELLSQLESGEKPEETPEIPDEGEDVDNSPITLKKVWDKVQEQTIEINTILGKYDIGSITLQTFQSYRQEENKELLKQFLQTHPILWTDGNYYGVSKDDQDEMIADKTAYEFKQSIGDTSWKLEWHNVKHACREFTIEEFASLLNAIIDFVYPYRRLQEIYKEKIYSCTTKEELAELVLEYDENALIKYQA